jgi:hypothetical protein
MASFVKFTLDGKRWSWCYGAAVSRTAGQIIVAQPMVPLGTEGPQSLAGGRLAWDDNTGRINVFAIPPPPWLGVRPEWKLPRSIPEEVRKRGLRATVEYALRGTYLARIFAQDAVRRTVGIDRLLRSAEDRLRCPQFVPEDEGALEEWAAARPAAAKFAAEEAAAIVGRLQLEGEAAALRALLRREAHRKLDAIKESFTNVPGLGGDPYLERPTPAGPVKVGALLKAVYEQGAAAAPISPGARNEALLRAVEDAILPGGGELTERLALVKWQRRFAAWEASNPRPALDYLHWGDANVPAGFVRREGLEGAPVDYSCLGVAWLISSVAAEYAATKAYTLPDPLESAEWCLGRTWAA